MDFTYYLLRIFCAMTDQKRGCPKLTIRTFLKAPMEVCYEKEKGGLLSEAALGKLPGCTFVAGYYDPYESAHNKVRV